MYDAQHQQFVDLMCTGEPALRTDLTRQQAVQQRQAIAQLQKHCQSMLAEARTSLETDEQLLQQQQRQPAADARQTQQAKHAQQALTPRHAQAVCARLEHKRLIAAAQSVLQTYSDTISPAVTLPMGTLQSR